MQCQVCSLGAAKYCCPRCSKRTCSANCVKTHKDQQSCNGMRDKTVFVKMSQYNDGTLLNDYLFLEEASRKLYTSRHDKLKNVHSSIPGFVRKLVTQARKRNIQLVTLPFPMSKRRNNKTYYNFKQQKIYWQLELVFPQADDAHYMTDREDEAFSLKYVLQKFFGPAQQVMSVKQQLWRYAEQEIDSLHVFMLAQGRAARRQGQYWKLNLNQTLAENLRNKLIYEYPTLYIVYGQQAINFQEKCIKVEMTASLSSECQTSTTLQNQIISTTSTLCIEQPSSVSRNNELQIGKQVDNELQPFFTRQGNNTELQNNFKEAETLFITEKVANCDRNFNSEAYFDGHKIVLNCVSSSKIEPSDADILHALENGHLKTGCIEPSNADLLALENGHLKTGCIESSNIDLCAFDNGQLKTDYMKSVNTDLHALDNSQPNIECIESTNADLHVLDNSQPKTDCMVESANADLHALDNGQPKIECMESANAGLLAFDNGQPKTDFMEFANANIDMLKNDQLDTECILSDQ